MDSNGIVVKRSLLAKDVNTAKKLAAEETFSHPHGNRKGGISQMALSGMDRGEVLSRANHSVKSSTSERVYQYKMSGPGESAVRGSSNRTTALSVADCRRIDAASRVIPPTGSLLESAAVGGSGGRPL